MRQQASNIALIAILILPLTSLAQYHYDSTAAAAKQKAPKKEHHIIGIGVKAGLNFANVTSASDINASSHTGFNAGIFFSPPGKLMGSYTELAFSQQGFDYSTGQNNSSLKLNYLSLEQLMAINITKYVQIQLGARTAYLLNAKTDSTTHTTGTDSAYNAYGGSLLSFFNRIDYGVVGGVEIHPVLGLVIGARYNLSLSSLYKNAFSSFGGTGSGSGSGSMSINPKNNVIQLYTGWRF
ncbi:porin family protein [Puia dinghuensis]|uniref:Outer membrane protein beta-barrel domain-containing protein n=1 Tax=Puia dinghuensis TaxID=1792502 RepID=A0A8J2U6A1_9BACT|nr:porin family protein [Puia dinghuensis]GGA81544.1 hypothetical protein GCM10011511_00600 [Puia dinghuensis]